MSENCGFLLVFKCFFYPSMTIFAFCGVIILKLMEQLNNVPSKFKVLEIRNPCNL